MLLSLPNYINGSYVESEERKILKDYKGNDFAVIYNVSSADIRSIKRTINETSTSLRKIKIEKIIKVIQKSMKYYFASEESFETISKLTGSPKNYAKLSINQLKQWASNLDDYLQMCFGNKNYDNVPILFKNKTIAYEKYIPSGPVIGILPKNAEAVSIYLLLQILLSRSPSLVKTSSSLGSSFSSLELIKAINKALDDIKDPELEVIRKSINILNVFNTEPSDILKKLEIEKANYVVFGSDDTIRQVENTLKDSKPNKIIKMGTGLSISLVLNDADLEFAAEEICVSASVDRGNDCVSTNIIYVQKAIFDTFLKIISNVSEKFESKDPFLKDSIVGHINKEDVETIKTRLSSIKNDAVLRGLPNTLHLSVLELQEHEHFEEFPGPVLGIRKFDDLSHFYSQFKNDLLKNKLDKNLISSVFTKNAKLFDEISSNINSYTFKLNKGSQKMNFLLEHQGTYLLKELLDKRIIEK